MTAFVVRVQKQQLPEGTPPDQITVRRYSEGTWDEQAATLLRETEDELVYRVETDGFSQFVMAAPAAQESGESPVPFTRVGPGPVGVGLGVLGIGGLLLLLLFLKRRRDEEEFE